MMRRVASTLTCATIRAAIPSSCFAVALPGSAIAIAGTVHPMALASCRFSSSSSSSSANSSGGPGSTPAPPLRTNAKAAEDGTGIEVEAADPFARPPVPGIVPLDAAAPGTYRLPRDYPLPPECLKWTYSRGSGPGGQGVNSSSNKAVLKVSLESVMSFCVDIEVDIIETLRDQAASHLTGNDEILVSSHEHRSLERNKKVCVKLVQDMLYAASYVPHPEKKHEPSHVGQSQDSILKHRMKTQKVKASRDAKKEVRNYA